MFIKTRFIWSNGENVGQGLLYRTPEHAAAAGFQVPSECPNFGAWKHCACNNDNKDENGIVAVAPNEVVEHIEFDLGLEHAENNEDVDVTNEEDDIEGTMQELNRWLQEADSIEDVDVYVDEHEGPGNDVEVLIENVDPLLDADPFDSISEVVPLEDDPLLDVDPFDAISEVIPLEGDPQSVDQAVRVPSPEPVDSSSGSASPVVDVASSSNAPPIAVASMADRLQRRPNAVHSQKRNRPPQCLKRSTHVDNQAAFVALTGGTLTPGRFTDEERELWVELYHAYRKRRNVFQAMHPRWMERTNEEGIHARTMDGNPITKTANNIRCFFTFYLFNIKQPITTISSNNKCSDECSWSSTHLYSFSCFCQTSSNGPTCGPFSVWVQLFWPSASNAQCK